MLWTMARLPLSPRWRRRLKRLALLALTLGALAVGGFFTLAYTVPLPARLTVGDSVVVTWRDGTVAHVFLADDDRWRIAPADVDPAYVEALLRLEDKRFYSHPGVDGAAIARAVGLNLARGRRVSGASTLTMQLVRLLEPRPRTYRSKLIEAFRALQLELFLSKRQILHHYLRFVPYGRNVEGVEAAALTYFGHRADALTPAEIATLLAVPQGPRTRSPSARRAPVLRRARDDIAARLLAQGALHAVGQAADPAQVFAQVRGAPVPTSYRPFPRDLPHAARWLRAQANPRDRRLPTTLDRGLQRLAQARLTRGVDALSARGVQHGAVVIIDHTTGEVRALVGNPRFGAGPGQQIAAFATPRSSGSTLKPLIFARAIDRGRVLPGVAVPDVPQARAGWTPRNFDGRYAGVVRLDDALARSLNAPFVDLLADLGVPALLDDLHSLGVGPLAPADTYGLSAAVGGVALSPLALAGVYTALAGDGRFLGVRVRRDADRPAPRTLWGPGTAWLTRQVLRRRDRPDFPLRRAATGAPAAFHWKTGTSTGLRDAWAVGSGPRLTIAVWLGNLDNQPSPALVGAAAAGPLLFDLLEATATPADAAWVDARPSDLVTVAVCADTGWPVGPACPTHGEALAPAHAVAPVDPYHRWLTVDARTGEAVDPRCRGAQARARRSALVWPAAVRRTLTALGHPPAPLPAPAADCPPRLGGAPRVINPAPGEIVERIPGVPPRAQAVPLQADVDVPSGPLSWFVDDQPIGQAEADAPLFWPPTPGTHAVRVVDAAGRTGGATLVVR